MADAIGRMVRSEEKSVPEAVDYVLEHEDEYRYRRPISSAAELEADTLAAYHKMQVEIGTLVARLRPEIAGSFSPEERSHLIEHLVPILGRLDTYVASLRNAENSGAQEPQRTLSRA